MGDPLLEVQLVATLTVVTCAVVGVFLVLRRMAMLADAISHAVLPGIVVAFFVARTLASPLLVLGAAAAGVVTVALIETIYRTGRLREDAAIGLVFPVLFALGVVLVSLWARDVHLDVDAVLTGELVFVPLDRFVWAGRDLGPKGLWIMGALLIMTLLFVSLFYKELVATTLDPGWAATQGIAPRRIHYAFVTLVALVVVGAFEVVGAILVVALFVGPAATALLWTRRLERVWPLTILFGLLAMKGGYQLAARYDWSLAGTIASTIGVVFGISWFVAPSGGWMARRRRAAWHQLENELVILVTHLLHHEGEPEAHQETAYAELPEHLSWASDRLEAVVRVAERAGLVRWTADGKHLELTERGRTWARSRLAR